MRFNASIIGCVGTISGSIVHVNIHVAKETRTRTFPAKYKLRQFPINTKQVDFELYLKTILKKVVIMISVILFFT